MTLRPSTVNRGSRRHRNRRAAAIGAVAVVALAVGITIGGGGDDDPRRERVERFVDAWARGDYASMHDELGEESERRTPLRELIDAYERDAATATAVRVRPGDVSSVKDGVVTVPVVADTRIFGPVAGRLRIGFEGDTQEAGIDWRRHMGFAGVPRGRRLERSTELAPRADILARDKTPLAEGEDRTSELGPVASAVSGELGPVPEERKARLRTLGFPPDAQVGVSGLERIFNERVAGRPGGTLRAGGDILARSRPRPGRDARTTIDPGIQRAAVEGLGARLGGVAALNPRTGEVLALSGVAFSGLQPPGSTFKIVTLAGALEAGVATPKSTYPVQTQTELEGVEIENANGESCGGTLRYSFAHSCNSVFAPMGAELGAKRLVETAEAFGFNSPPGIEGAATSSIPPAAEIGDRLAVGSSAIGQGQVQATALQMAWVAATIAGRGRRPALRLSREEPARRTQVIEPGVARQVGRYMVAVVEEGTGGGAAVPGTSVAGKTGTAELRDTSTPDCTPGPEAPCPAVEEDLTDTDAWFAAYAPAGEPRVAVGVLLVQSGTGGEFAAPVAKTVLEAALRRRG